MYWPSVMSVFRGRQYVMQAPRTGDLVRPTVIWDVPSTSKSGSQMKYIPLSHRKWIEGGAIVLEVG